MPPQQGNHLLVSPLTSPDTDLLTDYGIAYLSRELSIVARREVTLGRAGFAILGEGKELPQIAMAKTFQPGDWRSGYYRDQTFMLAVGALTAEQFFAQLYAHSDVTKEPASGGRQMNCHYASRFYHHGVWHDQTQMINVAADMSCTSGQLPRLIGLGYSSLYYRMLSTKNLSPWNTQNFSRGGNEVAFGTIGDAATAEGHFWETVNAMGVLQIPVALSVWDNGYGISVPTHLQTTKGSLAKVLPGFVGTNDPLAAIGERGVDFYHLKGWNFAELIAGYQKAITRCRQHHQPCVILVDELTQPLGHSSSGSHQRYKSRERLEWEKTHDGLTQLRKWILETSDVTDSQIEEIESETRSQVQEARRSAYAAWQAPFIKQKARLRTLTTELTDQIQKQQPESPLLEKVATTTSFLSDDQTLHNHLFHSATRRLLRLAKTLSPAPLVTAKLAELEKQHAKWGQEHYLSYLFVENHDHSPLHQVCCPPKYSATSIQVGGREVVAQYFHKKFATDPRVILMGEDVGTLGGVNLEFEGLKEAFTTRVIDTGIRELTILGQGHGMAMRGFRPIIDIQYLDYLVFCLQGMSDDIASLHYRTAGGQVSPVIIRSKGHRLMGIWHSGSPMAMILHSCRGIHLCTPRNMVQACGMYETLLKAHDPGMVIEPMNGYRKLERLPDNLGDYHVALGEVEFLTYGHDITVVTYGACCAIALEAASLLAGEISLEIIDCQTLHPFDRKGDITASLKKTHSLIVMDEDVPGGASSYILHQILDQRAMEYLDTPPLSITAAENRCSYSADGDYYCKPQADDLVDAALKILSDKSPARFHS